MKAFLKAILIVVLTLALRSELVSSYGTSFNFWSSGTGSNSHSLASSLVNGIDLGRKNPCTTFEGHEAEFTGHPENACSTGGSVDPLYRVIGVSEEFSLGTDSTCQKRKLSEMEVQYFNQHNAATGTFYNEPAHSPAIKRSYEMDWKQELGGCSPQPGVQGSCDYKTPFDRFCRVDTEYPATSQDGNNVGQMGWGCQPNTSEDGYDAAADICFAVDSTCKMDQSWEENLNQQSDWEPKNVFEWGLYMDALYATAEDGMRTIEGQKTSFYNRYRDSASFTTIIQDFIDNNAPEELFTKCTTDTGFLNTFRGVGTQVRRLDDEYEDDRVSGPTGYRYDISHDFCLFLANNYDATTSVLYAEYRKPAHGKFVMCDPWCTFSSNGLEINSYPTTASSMVCGDGFCSDDEIAVLDDIQTTANTVSIFLDSYTGAAPCTIHTSCSNVANNVFQEGSVSGTYNPTQYEHYTQHFGCSHEGVSKVEADGRMKKDVEVYVREGHGTELKYSWSACIDAMFQPCAYFGHITQAQYDLYQSGATIYDTDANHPVNPEIDAGGNTLYEVTRTHDFRVITHSRCGADEFASLGYEAIADPWMCELAGQEMRLGMRFDSSRTIDSYREEGDEFSDPDGEYYNWRAVPRVDVSTMPYGCVEGSFEGQHNITLFNGMTSVDVDGVLLENEEECYPWRPCVCMKKRNDWCLDTCVTPNFDQAMTTITTEAAHGSGDIPYSSYCNLTSALLGLKDQIWDGTFQWVAEPSPELNVDACLINDDGGHCESEVTYLWNIMVCNCGLATVCETEGEEIWATGGDSGYGNCPTAVSHSCHQWLSQCTNGLQDQYEDYVDCGGVTSGCDECESRSIRFPNNNYYTLIDFFDTTNGNWPPEPEMERSAIADFKTYFEEALQTQHKIALTLLGISAGPRPYEGGVTLEVVGSKIHLDNFLALTLYEQAHLPSGSHSESNFSPGITLQRCVGCATYRLLNSVLNEVSESPTVYSDMWSTKGAVDGACKSKVIGDPQSSLEGCKHECAEMGDECQLCYENDVGMFELRTSCCSYNNANLGGSRKRKLESRPDTGPARSGTCVDVATTDECGLGGFTGEMGPCYCDSWCVVLNDCCSDYCDSTCAAYNGDVANGYCSSPSPCRDDNNCEYNDNTCVGDTGSSHFKRAYDYRNIDTRPAFESLPGQGNEDHYGEGVECNNAHDVEQFVSASVTHGKGYFYDDVANLCKLIDNVQPLMDDVVTTWTPDGKTYLPTHTDSHSIYLEVDLDKTRYKLPGDAADAEYEAYVHYRNQNDDSGMQHLKMQEKSPGLFDVPLYVSKSGGVLDLWFSVAPASTSSSEFFGRWFGAPAGCRGDTQLWVNEMKMRSEASGGPTYEVQRPEWVTANIERPIHAYTLRMLEEDGKWTFRLKLDDMVHIDYAGTKDQPVQLCTARCRCLPEFCRDGTKSLDGAVCCGTHDLFYNLECQGDQFGDLCDPSQDCYAAVVQEQKSCHTPFETNCLLGPSNAYGCQGQANNLPGVTPNSCVQCHSIEIKHCVVASCDNHLHWYFPENTFDHQDVLSYIDGASYDNLSVEQKELMKERCKTNFQNGGGGCTGGCFLPEVESGEDGAGSLNCQNAADFQNTNCTFWPTLSTRLRKPEDQEEGFNVVEQHIAIRAAVPFNLPEEMKWRFWITPCGVNGNTNVPINSLEINAGMQSSCDSCSDRVLGCPQCEETYTIAEIQRNTSCFDKKFSFGSNEVFMLPITAYLIPTNQDNLPPSFNSFFDTYDSQDAWIQILQYMYSKKAYKLMVRKRTVVTGETDATLKTVLEMSIMSVDFQHDIKLFLMESCADYQAQVICWEAETCDVHPDEYLLTTIMPGEPVQLLVKVDENEKIQDIDRLEVETFKQMGRFGLEFVFIAGGVEKYDKMFARFISLGEQPCIEFIPMSQVRYDDGRATFYVSGILVIGTGSGARRLEVVRRSLQGAASNQEAELTVELLDAPTPGGGAEFSSEDAAENQMQSTKFPFVATLVVVASVVITAALIVLGIVVHAAHSTASAAAATTKH